MKHRIFLLLTLAVLSLTATAQKRIFIPEDLRSMNLDADSSKWCWHRSAETRDCIFFWERGFGNDLQNVPPLKGKPMNFNLSVLMERVQSFYTFFHDTLQFTRPGSKADRYKMMVMVMYSLEGTAYGGTYDNFIGGLWVAPNRIQDKTMNCMAHELGHSFQLQIPADSVGEAWGGSGFYEMTSQWMLWQVNPWWLRDENYHFEAFKKLTHKPYLDMENIYHSPYVIQWWSDLHGRPSIAELYREGRVGEDPVMTYKRLYHMSQAEFCDEMLRGYQHLVNFDFKHAWKETRPYACTFDTELLSRGGWLVPKDVPGAYGFNAIKLDDRVDLNASTYKVTVKGRNLRYGLVAVTSSGESIYSPIGATRFAPRTAGARREGPLKHLYLVVMGAPQEHHPLPMPHGEPSSAEPEQFPYQFKVSPSR